MRRSRLSWCFPLLDSAIRILVETPHPEPAKTTGAPNNGAGARAVRGVRATARIGAKP